MLDEKYNIRDIEFVKSDLKEIKIDEFIAGELLAGHLYHFSRATGKPIFILQAGEILEQKFLDRYGSGGVPSLWMLSIVNEQHIAKFEYLLGEFKQSRREEDFWKVRSELVSDIKLLFGQESKLSFLNLMIPFYKTFAKDTELHITPYLEHSSVVFKRSLISATLSALYAIAIGYLDYQFIKEIYLVSLFKDIGLMNSSFDYRIQQACEHERRQPGQGLQYLIDKKVAQEKIDYFQNHPLISANFIKENKIINNKSLIEGIKLHHELASGKGFPRKVNARFINDFESIINLADYLVPFEEYVFSKHGDYSFSGMLVQAIRDGVVEKTLSKRVFPMIKAIFDVEIKEVG